MCVGIPPALWASLGRGSGFLEKLVLWVGKTCSLWLRVNPEASLEEVSLKV